MQKIENLGVWEENKGELFCNLGVEKAFVSMVQNIETIKGKKLNIYIFLNSAHKK